MYSRARLRYIVTMTTAVDIAALREQFPILVSTMRGKPLVYLDNSATSLKPRLVIEAERAYMEQYSANIHRGVYQMSERATAEYDSAREAVAKLIGARGNGHVIFTRGTTESLNLLAYAWALPNLKPGDEILITPLEHHSNLVPWQQVAKRCGAVLRFIELDDRGRITPEAVDRSIGNRTRLVSITGMSNVTGYLPPIEYVTAAAHRVGAVVVIDGAQYVSHHPVDVERLDCDAIAFSGHKMCGPTGIGALYAKTALLEQMEPFHFGGDMIQTVGLYESTWADLPERFEAGTPNIGGAVAFGAAARFLASVGMDAVLQHERELTAYMSTRMRELNYVDYYGPVEQSEHAGVFSFNMRGVHPHDVGSLLDQQGIAVRTGFHCAQPLMQHFGVTGTVRASFYIYNTRDEIDRFIEALDRVRSVIG